MALDIPEKHSTTEPHFQTVEVIFQSGWVHTALALAM